MTTAKHIAWFKKQFGARIEAAVAGTPITLDLMAALACQETGEMWPVLRLKNMSETEILSLCVGDTLDEAQGRSAFPRTKAALVAKPRGQEMFEIAHQALVDMSVHDAPAETVISSAKLPPTSPKTSFLAGNPSRAP